MNSNRNKVAIDNINEFVEAVSNLAIANRLTGLWDHVRFEECKKAFSDVDPQRIYLSEKNSRKNVEERAVQRKKLDLLLVNILAESI